MWIHRQVCAGLIKSEIIIIFFVSVLPPSSVQSVGYVYFVRLSVSSSAAGCNSTLPPPATCARVLRENTGFCIGVRRPHGGGAKVH